MLDMAVEKQIVDKSGSGSHTRRDSSQEAVGQTFLASNPDLMEEIDRGSRCLWPRARRATSALASLSGRRPQRQGTEK